MDATVSQFVGFHGNPYLQEVVHSLLSRSKSFIETGTHHGDTLLYVAMHYPVKCFSCEPHSGYRNIALAALAGLSQDILAPSVEIYALESLAFLSELRLKGYNQEPCTFWLDAHGHGFAWPLAQEVAYISEHWPVAYVLIDDCYVPGKAAGAPNGLPSTRPGLYYEQYGGQRIAYEIISPGLTRPHRLYYPSYQESDVAGAPYRGSVRIVPGWCLVVWGDEEPLPDGLKIE